MSDKGQGNHGARRMPGLSEDQRNASYILEKIMLRRNYSSQTRDDIADCLEVVRQGGELGKAHKVRER